MTDDQIEKLSNIEVADNSGDEEEGDDGVVDSAAADAPKKKKSKIYDIILPLTSLFKYLTFVSYTISHAFHTPHYREEEEKEEEEICS